MPVALGRYKMDVVAEDVSLILAFGGGLLSFFSPCVLPMVPVYLAMLTGPGLFEKTVTRVPALLHSLSFVLGFTAVFVILGAIFGLTGYAINPDFSLLRTIAGWLLIAFGVFLLAANWIPWLNFEKRLSPSVGSKTGYLRSFIIGAAFSLSWTACVAPILGSILAIASTKATAWQGAYLLAIYSLGLGVPFLVVGVAFDWVIPLLKRIHRYTGIIHIISGLLLIIVGILILTGTINLVSSVAG